MNDLITTLNNAGYKTVCGAEAVLDAIADVSDGSEGLLCSGYGVFPDGSKCDGCNDCFGVEGKTQTMPLDRDGRDDDAPEGYPATNEDGTTPEIEGDVIYIKETRCHSGCGCGGCYTGWYGYPIDGTRFHWNTEK